MKITFNQKDKRRIERLEMIGKLAASLFVMAFIALIFVLVMNSLSYMVGV